MSNWTNDKPTEPGAYWVRRDDDTGLLEEALIQVKDIDGELWCNLHGNTTEPVNGFNYSIRQLDPEFEWLGPLEHPSVTRKRVADDLRSSAFMVTSIDPEVITAVIEHGPGTWGEIREKLIQRDRAAFSAAYG